MNVLKHISLPVFIASLVLGLLFLYFIGTDEKVIYVYPSPENCGKTQYEDKAGNCFKYNSTEIKCPSDTSLIKTIPMQN